eukprot:8970145-Alexandrium_andersonii.AAC.2
MRTTPPSDPASYTQPLFGPRRGHRVPVAAYHGTRASSSCLPRLAIGRGKAGAAPLQSALLAALAASGLPGDIRG